MPELPPRAEVLDALQKAVAPSAGAAVVVFGGLLLLAYLISQRVKFNWRAVAPPAAVLALAAAMLAGNHFPEVFGEYPAGWNRWWHWAWPALGLALVVELFARLPGVAVGVGHLMRGVAAGAIAATVVPADWQTAERWWIPALATVMAIQWAVVDAVGRRGPGGATSLAVAVAAFGTAAILLHHAWPRPADVAFFVAFSLLALAILAFATQTETGSAAAVGTVPLVVFLFLGRALQDSAVPRSSFYLVAFAPLTLGLLLFPGIDRLNATRGGTFVKLLLVLAPVAWAVYRAMEAAPLSFGESDEWQ